MFAIGQHHAGQLSIFDQHVSHALLKAHFATQRDDLLAHVFNNTRQTERTDVRFADVENLIGRARFDKLVQDFAAVVFWVFDLAVELAVRECACAALTKLHVGFRVEHVFTPQSPGVFGALAHFCAALNDDRLEAHLCQQQARENTAGPEADHNWAFAQVLRCLAYYFVADIGGWIDVAVIRELDQQRRFIAHAQVNGVDKAQLGRLFACVITALEQGEVEQFIAGDAQALQNGRAKVFFGMVDRQLEFGDS